MPNPSRPGPVAVSLFKSGRYDMEWEYPNCFWLKSVLGNRICTVFQLNFFSSEATQKDGAHVLLHGFSEYPLFGMEKISFIDRPRMEKYSGMKIALKK
jgi:hypothetical protein